MGQTSTPLPMMMLLLIEKRFTRRSFWPWFVTMIFPNPNSELEGDAILYLWRNFLCKWSTSNWRFLVSSLCDTWLPILEWLLLVWVVCTLASRSFLCSRLRKWSCRWDLTDSSQFGLEPAMIDLDSTLFFLFPIDSTNCMDLIFRPPTCE